MSLDPCLLVQPQPTPREKLEPLVEKVTRFRREARPGYCRAPRKLAISLARVKGFFEQKEGDKR